MNATDAADQLAAMRRCEEAQRSGRTAGAHRLSDLNYYIHASTNTTEEAK